MTRGMRYRHGRVIMRVLIISRFCASPVYRAKIAALARRPGLEVSLLAPAEWKEGDRTLICREGIEDGYRIFTGSLIFNGRVGGHVYGNGLWKALSPDISPRLWIGLI